MSAKSQTSDNHLPDGQDRQKPLPARHLPAYAIIAAAGSGSRMALAQNKQFLQLGGKSVITRTVYAFTRCRRIAGIVIVGAAGELGRLQNELGDVSKLLVMAAGGATRLESVANGLSALLEHAAPDPDCPVLVHDGARCFIGQDVINRVIDGIVEYGACGAAIPVKDTIKRAGPDGLVRETVDRQDLRSMQTPQGARWSLLWPAYQTALAGAWPCTDDLAVLEMAGIPVRLLPGDDLNIKLTTPADALLGECLANYLDQLDAQD